MIFHQSHSFLAISQHLRDKIFKLNSQHSMFLLPFLTLEYPLIIETHLIFFQKQCYSLIKKSYAPNDPPIPKPLTYDHQPKKSNFSLDINTNAEHKEKTSTLLLLHVKTCMVIVCGTFLRFLKTQDSSWYLFTHKKNLNFWQCIYKNLF